VAPLFSDKRDYGMPQVLRTSRTVPIEPFTSPFQATLNVSFTILLTRYLAYCVRIRRFCLKPCQHFLALFFLLVCVSLRCPCQLTCYGNGIEAQGQPLQDRRACALNWGSRSPKTRVSEHWLLLALSAAHVRHIRPRKHLPVKPPSSFVPPPSLPDPTTWGRAARVREGESNSLAERESPATRLTCR
jgi:hypothetical protein